jgi:hypothetical protein
MSASKMTKGVAEGSPQIKARIAGALYLVSVLAAVSGEFLMRGKLGVATVIVPVSCYVVVTLLLYGIFKPVSRGMTLLAVSSGLIGLTLEALPWHPLGVNIGMVFHGLYFGLIGYLIVK